MARILDQHGKPIPPDAIARMREEEAGPTVFGLRQPWSTHPAEGLTPARLAAIHREAGQGNALRYLELAEDIEERDLHYAGVLRTRKLSVTQLPIRVEAASDDAEHVKHADFVRDWLSTEMLQDVLFDVMDAVGKGFSVHEIVWLVDAGGIVPEKLIHRPARWFDVSLQDGETIMLRDTATLTELLPHKFWVHKHKSKSGLVMRSWAWMYKAFTLRDWATFVQNYGPCASGSTGPRARRRIGASSGGPSPTLPATVRPSSPRGWRSSSSSTGT